MMCTVCGGPPRAVYATWSFLRLGTLLQVWMYKTSVRMTFCWISHTTSRERVYKPKKGFGFCAHPPGVWASCSPDFSLSMLESRFSDLSPALLVTTDAFQFRGKMTMCDLKVSEETTCVSCRLFLSAGTAGLNQGCSHCAGRADRTPQMSVPLLQPSFGRHSAAGWNDALNVMPRPRFSG